MQCLEKSENAVLDFFLAKGDKGVPLYRCAQDLAGKVNMREVADACVNLEHLGLIREIGAKRSGKVYKLSSAAVGDIRSGYFAETGHGGDGLAAMMLKLEKLEVEHKAAVLRMESHVPTGGQVQDPRLKPIAAAAAAANEDEDEE